jgi:hypothetical protein
LFTAALLPVTAPANRKEFLGSRLSWSARTIAFVALNQIYQTKEIERLDAKLKPFGKSLSQAVDFYIHFMQEDMKKSVIPPIEDLCRKWYEEKTKNSLEPLRKRTSIEYKSGDLC